MVAVPPPGGSGTTARAKAGERQDPVVQPLQRAVQPLGRNNEQERGEEARKTLSLSLTPKEGKERVRKVYVN